MDGGFAPRFVLEVAFLALLALAVGLAELGTAAIIGVMTGGWVLVTLIELLAWRSEAQALGRPAARRSPVEPEPALPPEESTSWDIQEILVPLPEEDEQLLEPVESMTGAMPAAEAAAVEPPEEPSGHWRRWLRRTRRGDTS